jgi:hypothetical protein
MRDDTVQHPRERLPQAVADGGAVLMAAFCQKVEQGLGVQVREQRDPSGRLVSYGYHWHQPDAQRDRGNYVVYGFATLIDALYAGLVERAQEELASPVPERTPVPDVLITRCKG